MLEGEIIFFILIAILIIICVGLIKLIKDLINDKEILTKEIESLEEKLSFYRKIDYENDIIFLNKLIDDKIDKYYETVIKPMDAANNKTISSKIMDEISTNLSLEIFKSLSETYKYTLYKYFTEESLSKYIVEYTYTRCLKIVNSLNKKKISSLNNK